MHRFEPILRPIIFGGLNGQATTYFSSFSDRCKNLGIYFDSNMTWNTYVTYICSKLSGVPCVLCNVRSFMPSPTCQIIVHLLASSNLRYGTALFYHCSFTWHSKVNCTLGHIVLSVPCSSTFHISYFIFHISISYFTFLPTFHAHFFFSDGCV